MSQTVVGLANAVIDMSFLTANFPILPSEHQFMDHRLITPGGMANTLICGARLGLKTKAIGNIGKDAFADIWRHYLVEEGVDFSDMVVYEAQPTPLSICLTGDAGKHVFLGARGELRLRNGRFPQAWAESIAESDGLLIYGWNFLSQGAEGNLEAMKVAQNANIPIFFDPGPEIPDMPRAWLERMMQADVVMVTYEEAQLIVEESLEPKTMAERLRQMGSELVILKLGGDGMIGHTATETIYEPGIMVDVVDLTGAGDSVAAAVVMGYLEKYDLPKLLKIANATGAAAVQKFGAGINVPNWEEITAVLAQQKT